MASNSGQPSITMASEATIKDDRDRLVLLETKVKRLGDYGDQLRRASVCDGKTDVGSITQWQTAASSNVPNRASVSQLLASTNRSAHDAVTKIQADGSVLVPLGKMAFLPAKLEQPRKLLVEGGKLALSGEPSRGEAKLEEIPFEKAKRDLQEYRKAVEQDMQSLKDSVLTTARTMLIRHLEEEKDAPNVNEKGQALNEEGLPFVDLNEPDAGDPSDIKAPIPMLPVERKSKEERQAWMDKIFDDIENGGEGHFDDEDSVEMATSAGTQEREVLPLPSPSPRKESSAANNTARPIKSALKPSSVPTPPVPKFGHSGFKNGFLNLNPSSPAAVHSSDPVDDIKWEDEALSGSTSSLGSAAERLSRSTDMAPKKKKKSVRIQSPEARDRRDACQASQLSAPLQLAKESTSTARSLNDQDEDTSIEAARILNLLGTDVMKGHPDYDKIMEGKRLQDEANAAAAKRAAEKYAPPKASSSGGPAVRTAVTERPSAPANGAIAPKSSVSDKFASAFRKGFLNTAGPSRLPPPRLAAAAKEAALPAAPRVSQGVSALERATKSDEVISEQRVQQGLTPSVPHARPSKAYAEKMEARKRGEALEPQEGEEKEDPTKMSKVRFQTNGGGAMAVKIGTAATEATGSASSSRDAVEETGHSDDDDDVDSDSSSRDEELRAMGLDIREEELDDETVEALGYISDPDHDPDIGFDSDDLVESVPTFASDGTEIDNDDLRREYERTKAAVLKSQGVVLGQSTRSNIDDEDEELAAMEGTDLSLYGDDDSGAGMADAGQSRFRRERTLRAMQGQRAISRELSGWRPADATNGNATLEALSQARNVGPSMLIPSLAKVRFPKPTNGTDSSHDSGINVELDGQSDEEDDQLVDVMRARLDQRDYLQEQAGAQAPTAKQQEQDGPPVVRSATTSKAVSDAAPQEIGVEKSSGSKAEMPSMQMAEADAAAPAPARKKPSLFKARMQQQ